MNKLSQKIVKLLKKKKLKISVAESCTGGMFSSVLTSVSGSSKVFTMGFVTYSNQSKNRLLKVPNSIINKYGAVSHQTAMSMVKGLKKISKSEILVSVTGVAGPSGGSTKTPVGCVYFGLGIKIKNKYHFTTIKQIFKERSRQKIQEKSLSLIHISEPTRP